MPRLANAVLAAVVSCGLLCGQETRGVIFGRVLDPQSSAVAGARVVVTDTDTNTSTYLTTNPTGYYEANLLLPGNYQVSIESSGFKKAVRSGVVLAVSSRAEVSVRLELGAVAETISVTAEAPMLDTSSVSSGRVLDNRSLMDLPVLGNSATLLVKLTPGIQTSGVNNYLGLHSNVGGSDYNTSGGVGGNEWSIDGVPNNGPGRRLAYLPYSDTLQEFKVETSNFDASIGHSTGVNVSMLSKSGSNEYHGTLTEQHWQQRWNGTPFFVKQQYYRSIAAAKAKGDEALARELASRDKQSSGHSHNYAGTIGGPVRIPRLYNGRDKLFFFFSYNGFKDNKHEEANQINKTVPTLANRQGDFSQLLSVDAVRYQIYDPLSVRPDPARAGHFLRTPFAGNILPQSRIVNPVYGNYVKLYPGPNNDPGPNKEPRNNFLAVATPFNWDYTAYANRVDYQPSDRHRFFGRWSWNDFQEDRGDWTYSTLRGLNTNGLNRHNLGATVDWVFTKSASTVINVVVAANEFREGDRITVPLQLKPTDMGFPGYMDDKAADKHMMPQITVNGYTNAANRGGFPTFTRYRLLTQKADLTHIHGRHSVRAGVDTRQHFRTGGGGGNTSGNFNFSNQYTRRNDDGFTPAGDFGLAWAAFMMGLPASMNIATSDSYATLNPYYAWFVQDNWRITPKLTLNLGLRNEYELGPTERYNRAIAYFDSNAVLPITQWAQAAYAAKPVPELAAANFAVRGGSIYAGANGASRRLWQNELMWLPRVGVSYQWNDRTVLRGGYGVFFDTNNVLVDGPDQTGFSRTTSTLLTTNFGQTWLAGDPLNGISPLVNPFPVRADGTRFDVPTRDALGLMARVGRGWDFTEFDRVHARQQRWRFGVQRQFGANLLVEVAYSGSYSDRIGINKRLDPLPEQFWAGGLVRRADISSNLDLNVTNPFFIQNFADLQRSNPLVYQDMTTQGFFNSPTIRKSQLLRPYPQIAGSRLLDKDLPVGEARTHALELSFERRFSKGLNFHVGYTRLSDRDATFFLNEFDPRPTWRESNDSRPHRFIGSTIYELPMGRGRKWARSGWSNLLFGGFQLAATYEWQPGPLIDWGNRFYYGDIADIGKGPRTLDRWFNTDNFERNSAKGPASFHRRIFPTRIDGLRRDMTNQWNANVQREFKLRERLAFQLRMDALNLFNRSQFDSPNTDPFSTNFGKVEQQTAATNRWIQIQGRIRF